MSLTTFLAVYAAIASSIVLGWNLYRIVQDRTRIKISVSLMQLTMGTDGRQLSLFPLVAGDKAADNAHVVITITNAGRDPVTLQGWGGEWKVAEQGKDKFAVISQGLPRILNGHECHREFTPDLSVVSPNIKSIFVRDSSGKNWYVSDKGLQAAVKQAHKYVSLPRT